MSEDKYYLAYVDANRKAELLHEENTKLKQKVDKFAFYLLEDENCGDRPAVKASALEWIENRLSEL